MPLTLGTLAVLGAACGGDARPPSKAKGSGDLATVEVPPPPDARVDVSRDVQERRRAEIFAGVMPARFPRALPLPAQASLVDQGGGRGGAWVELLVPRRPDAVRTPYLQQLRAAGWEVNAVGADSWRCRLQGDSVEAHAAGAGTEHAAAAGVLMASFGPASEPGVGARPARRH